MTGPALRETEAGFQEWVRDLALALGWRFYHTRYSKGSDGGWPDVCLARPPRFIVAELKVPGGRLDRAQRDWLEVLASCGVETYVWRPVDRPAIERILAR